MSEEAAVICSASAQQPEQRGRASGYICEEAVNGERELCGLVTAERVHASNGLASFVGRQSSSDRLPLELEGAAALTEHMAARSRASILHDQSARTSLVLGRLTLAALTPHNVNSATSDQTIRSSLAIHSTLSTRF